MNRRTQERDLRSASCWSDMSAALASSVPAHTNGMSRSLAKNRNALSSTALCAVRPSQHGVNLIDDQYPHFEFVWRGCVSDGAAY